MAKSARASVTKANRSALRSKVFGPVEAARARRLSEKLLQIASQPATLDKKDGKAPDEMEVEGTEAGAASEQLQQLGDDMEIDNDTKGNPVVRKKSLEKTPSRVQKKRRGKAASQITFPKLGRGSKKSGNRKKAGRSK